MISIDHGLTIRRGAVEVKETGGCLKKIWRAVSAIFQEIGERIQQGALWAKHLFIKKNLARSKETPFECNLQKYKDLPSDPNKFRQQAIALFASHLPQGEQKEFASRSAQNRDDPRVKAALVRGYIFSEVRKQFDFGPFSKHTPRLNQYRALFNRLSDHEKEIVLNPIDPSPNTKIELSPEAKNILEAIREISTEIRD